MPLKITVPFLIRNAALDKKLAYEAFSYWVLRYWLLVEPYIKEFRANDDPHGWENLEILARLFLKMEKKKNRELKHLNKEALKKFLMEEKKLNYYPTES